VKIVAVILAAYMLLGSFFPASDFGQLVRIPELLKHYQYHISLDSEAELSLSSFIWDHFLDTNDHHDDGNASHQKLPIQSGFSGMNLIAASMAVCRSNVLGISVGIYDFYPFWESFDFQSSLIQPPIQA
jgi:hypothetical protein